MENATKALLIAAAILIAILLIAFGMGITRPAQDVTDQAGEVSDTLTTQTQQEANKAIQAITGIPAATE